MGTWGTKVLQNDACGDYMWKIYHMMFRSSAASLHDMVEHLLRNPDSPNYNDDNYRMLGIAIVDASMHDYDPNLLKSIKDDTYCRDINCEFFRYMKLVPLPDLVPLAKENLQLLISKKAESWRDSAKEDRMSLYQTYMSRLEEVE